MVGTMQKIKDALTPGHNRHNDGTMGATGTTYQGTDYNAGGYNTTGTTAYGAPGTVTAPAGTPVRVEVGAAPMGTGVPLATDSAYTTSSSESGYAARGAAVTNTQVAGTVCNVREFTEVEDRPIVKERVERVVEHVPVEKKFVVETRPVGETVLGTSTVESMGVTETVVERAAGTVCPTTGAVERAIGGTAATTTYDRCADGRCDRI